MIHLVVQQKVTQHCKATIPQFKKKKPTHHLSLYISRTLQLNVLGTIMFSPCKSDSFTAPIYLGYDIMKLESHPLKLPLPCSSSLLHCPDH